MGFVVCALLALLATAPVDPAAASATPFCAASGATSGVTPRAALPLRTPATAVDPAAVAVLASALRAAAPLCPDGAERRGGSPDRGPGRASARACHGSPSASVHRLAAAAPADHAGRALSRAGRDSAPSTAPPPFPTAP